ncbi:MOSC domain-containing protein [Rhodanobacter aciditrophus]|uniref:MOSC domain-containing protein n=1 Tax=Rhodanobacter aciditrophus TaxID=1623218 RepID=A0ABW4B0Q0_9GAMM
MSLYLSHLNIYPIKSTHHIPLLESKVLFSGLKDDRRYMLVDESGLFITARTHPHMSLIKTKVTNQGLLVESDQCGGALILDETLFSSERLTVDIWETLVDAKRTTNEADKWFSDALEEPVKLVYFDEESARYTKKDSTDPVAFADGYPFLLTTEASLNELNETTAHQIEMLRFRPNLVISGSKPFAEDTWKIIRIGDVVFENQKPCTRCIFTTLDPVTAQRSPKGEPLKSLAKFRLVNKEGVTFGVNLVAQNEGEIKVGDSVEILEYKEPEKYEDRRKPKS